MDDAEMEVRIRRTRDGSAEAVMDMHVSGAPVLSAEGSIRRNAAVGGPVMLQADAAVDVPLALAVPFLPGVLHMAGSASGSFSLSGPLARPTPRGTIQVEQGAVRVAGDVPTFSLVDATVSVDANGIRLSELYAELGHAPLRANGSLTWSEGALQVSADLTGTDALLVRTPDLRGRSDLDVSVRGTLPNLRVSGDLRLTDVLYTRPVQLVSFGTPRTVTRGVQLFSLRGPVAQGTTLDVSVQGPDAVRIDNNLLQTTLSADLRIGGTAAVPEPEGRLFTDTGTVRLPLSTLQIQQAELRFPRDRAFQPTLRAQLQTRMDQRRIVAAVSGPLSDLAVDVSSSPPLPNDEVLLLLTTGSTSSELTESVTYRETAAALGTYLSRRVLQEIAGTPRDGAVVDRLSVQVDPGIVTEGQGGFRIQYRVDDEEPWYVILERQEDDRYSLEFAYRLWF
jgi:translocation and assembly module TamB